MSSKSSMLFLGLLIGAASVPASFAAANAPDNRSATAAQQTAAATAQKKKAAALRKKKQQQQAAAAAKARQAKALEAKQLQQQAKKKEWYADDRDRGLDIAAKYAPKTIARVRARQYIAKGDTVRTGKGKTGWQHYMDRYYSR